MVFGGLVIAQSLHCVEHVVQLLQRYVDHQPAPDGLLGAWLNTEWVHLCFNAAVGILLLLLFYGYRMYEPAWRHWSPLGWWAMVGAIGIEDGLHVPEHLMRIYQFIRYGWDPAPGILGHTAAHGHGPFDLVPLHSAYNLVVTTLIIVAFIAFNDPGRRAAAPPRVGEN